MQRYEYKVVPAPRKGEKVKGAKTTEARFAHALSRVMNEMAADGWDYLRTDTLPVEERVGLTGRTTTFQHMLVFRKELAPAAAPLARLAPPTDADQPAPEADAMDAAARRAALLFARPEAGAAPRISTGADKGLAPSVGPARPAGANGTDQAAE